MRGSTGGLKGVWELGCPGWGRIQHSSSERASPLARNFQVAFLPFPQKLCLPLLLSIIWAGDGNFIFLLSLGGGVRAAVSVQECSLLLPALTLPPALLLLQETLYFS